MKNTPRLRWRTSQAVACLLLLLTLAAFKQRSNSSEAQTSGQTRSGLRVARAANWPADLLVSMVDLGTNDFHAPKFTSFSYTDPYVLERGLGKGGIRLMSEGARPVREFTIPRRDIEGIVRLRYDMDVVDWTDVIIGRTNITLIHTDYANAGAFLPSDIYVFSRSENIFDYLKLIEDKASSKAWASDDLKLLYPALLFYEKSNPRNSPGH